MLRNKNTDSSQARRMVVLPWPKSVEIALKNIRVRIQRSLITMLSLVLAVSFLGFTLLSTDLANGMLSTGDPLHFQSLVRAGYDLAPGDVRVESAAKQRWIVFLSLLVCTVGIVNAQLMAVTERFREIGTMKCLGALDRFILRLFIIEAFMQGIAGAVIGASVGAAFALLNALLRFGTISIHTLSPKDAATSWGIAVLTGCVLSILGVLWPAILASRMRPVEAMRVEQ